MCGALLVMTASAAVAGAGQTFAALYRSERQIVLVFGDGHGGGGCAGAAGRPRSSAVGIRRPWCVRPFAPSRARSSGDRAATGSRASPRAIESVKLNLFYALPRRRNARSLIKVGLLQS